MYATASMQTDFHSHYAATLAISLREPIRIETEAGAQEYRAALVAPNTYHRTVSPGVAMVSLLIDPETYEYQSIADFAGIGDVKRLDISAFQALMSRIQALYLGHLDDSEVRELSVEMLRCVHPFPLREKKIDERIRIIAARIRTELPDSIRMKEISKDFSISEDRLMRLFKKNLGIPLRRYLLWVRLQEAFRLLREGKNLTEVAHGAGFSDSAHFSRTFKENFGFVPSLFFGHLRSVELRICNS